MRPASLWWGLVLLAGCTGEPELQPMGRAIKVPPRPKYDQAGVERAAAVKTFREAAAPFVDEARAVSRLLGIEADGELIDERVAELVAQYASLPPAPEGNANLLDFEAAAETVCTLARHANSARKARDVFANGVYLFHGEQVPEKIQAQIDKEQGYLDADRARLAQLVAQLESLLARVGHAPTGQP